MFQKTLIVCRGGSVLKSGLGDYDKQGFAMSSKSHSVFRDVTSFFNIGKEERIKVSLLTLCFFLVIASYSLVKELKDTFFISTVGLEYISHAKLATLFFLVPAVLFFSMLVDRVRRYQLLCIYSVIFALIGFASIFVIASGRWGMPNTDSGPLRIFGWLFYFAIESYSPFLVSLFWAFANSVTKPDEAKRTYAVMVSGSKIGGMLSTGFAWWFLSQTDGAGCRLYTDVYNHQVLLVIFTILVSLLPFALMLLIKKVPGYQLHGYEAVYQYEKEKQKEPGSDRPGIFSGLALLIKWPYVLGIFGMLFFYEAVQTILSFQRLGVARDSSSDISGMSCFLFKTAFLMHAIGLVISFVATQSLLKRLGERRCLLLVPLSTAVLLFAFLASYSAGVLVWVLMLIRAINYAFAQPVRESLYIPTVKDMKFKSKSWIDAFGSKMAKAFGSSVTLLIQKMGQSFFFPVLWGVFGVIIAVWTLTAYLLGRRYETAIKNNEVIG